MIDSLELRRFLSSSLSSGVLTVTGTSSANTIDLTVSGTNIVVNEHTGSTKSYATASVVSIVIDGKEGSDKITVSNSITKPSTIYGGTGNDTVFAGGGNDSIRGGDGNDQLDGRNGNDTVKGDSDVDACLGEAGNDKLDGGGGNDYLDGGSGNDTADYSSRTVPLSFSVTPTGAQGGQSGETDKINQYVETIVGGSANDYFAYGGSLDVTTEGITRSVALDGRGGNDTFQNANVPLEGGTVNATLLGGDGNDIFHAELTTGQGRMTILGGNGDDIVYPATEEAFTPDQLVADMGPGTDAIDFAGSNSVQTFDMHSDGSLENVLNAYGDVIGNDLNNLITLGQFIPSGRSVLGNGGNDTLVGSAGADSTLNGGDGNDILRPVEGNSWAKLIGGIGNDTADYSAYTGDVKVSLDNVQNDGTAGNSFGDNVSSDVETVLGGSGNDSITGSDASNSLKGNAGNDTIRGGHGNDTLDGGSGADMLYGEGGYDTIYSLDGTKDTVDGGTGTLDKAHHDSFDVLTGVESSF